METELNTLNTKQLIYNLQPNETLYLILSKKYYEYDPELNGWHYEIRVNCNDSFLYSVDILRVMEHININVGTLKRVFQSTDYSNLTINEAINKLNTLKNSNEFSKQNYEIYFEE